MDRSQHNHHGPTPSGVWTLGMELYTETSATLPEGSPERRLWADAKLLDHLGGWNPCDTGRLWVLSWWIHQSIGFIVHLAVKFQSG